MRHLLLCVLCSVAAVAAAEATAVESRGRQFDQERMALATRLGQKIDLKTLAAISEAATAALADADVGSEHRRFLTDLHALVRASAVGIRPLGHAGWMVLKPLLMAPLHLRFLGNSPTRADRLVAITEALSLTLGTTELVAGPWPDPASPTLSPPALPPPPPTGGLPELTVEQAQALDEAEQRAQAGQRAANLREYILSNARRHMPGLQPLSDGERTLMVARLQAMGLRPGEIDTLIAP